MGIRFFFFTFFFCVSFSSFAQKEQTIDFFFTDDQILEEELIDITQAIYAPLRLKIQYSYGDAAVPSNFRKILEKNLEWSGLFKIARGSETASLGLQVKDSIFSGVQLSASSGGRAIYRDLMQFEKNPTLNELKIIDFIDRFAKKLSGRETSLSKAILFTETGANRSKKIVISDANGLRKKVIIDDGNLNLFPNFSPDGTSFMYTNLSDAGSKIIHYDFKTRKSNVIAHYKGLSTGGDWYDNRTFVTSISGKNNADLYRLDLKGNVLQKLTYRSSIESSPRIFGRQMVFISDRSGSIQIYKMNLDTRKARRLTFFSNYSSEPKFSNDGEYILFSANSGGGIFQIFMMDKNGRSIRRVTNDPASSEQPGWSSDDRLIIFSQKSGRKKKLMIMTIDGQQKRFLTGINPEAQISQPDWSGNFDWKLIF